MRKRIVAWMPVTIVVLSCACAGGDLGSSSGAGYGSLQFNLETPESVSDPFMATMVVRSLFSPDDVYLVECETKPHSLDGSAFCDELLVVPAGVYEVVVQPRTQGCRTTSAWYKVLVEENTTTEVRISIVCGVDTGGLDVVVTTEYEPSTTDITFTIDGEAANKYICQGPASPDVTATVQVVDEDSTCEEITAVWAAVDEFGADATAILIQSTSAATNGLCLFSAVIDAQAPLGSYSITIELTDADGHSSSFTFPVHLIDCRTCLYHSDTAAVVASYEGLGLQDVDWAFFNADPALAPMSLGPPSLLSSSSSSILGGIDLGDLTDYIFFFADGNVDANWQGATHGFVGDVGVDGIQASERTSGTVPYAGTMYTNDTTLGAWQSIVTANAVQAVGVTGETTRIADLQADLIAALQQISLLAPTPGFASVASTALNGLNTQNGVDETFVINVTSGLSFTSKIYVTGDAGDVFVLRWDTDANPANGYNGQVKPSSGGAIVPLGGLVPSNFINVAGDINASGGGTNPLPPYPQGPRYLDGTGPLIIGGTDFTGGGFFTGYWLTTGAPTLFDPGSGLYYGETAPLSNGIFVGGWYSLTTKFSMTSGTSGVYVSPNPATLESPSIDLEKYVSADGGLTWEDADLPTGPVMPLGATPLFKFVVTNTGTTTLAPVTVTDDVMGSIGSLMGLAPRASFEWVVAWTWAPGQHADTATATGVYGGTDYSDSDPAHYYGATAPAIDVEKFVSADGVTWVDADAAPGPEIPAGTPPQFLFVVTNTGTVTLTSVTVTDDVMGFIGSVPTLAAGASASWVVTWTWVAGQHVDTATAAGLYDGVTYTDTDPAHYYGVTNPSIDLEKYVSVDGGLTWEDADFPPGPYIAAGILPQFKFVVTNDGGVPLTGINVSDNVLGIIGGLVSMAPGETFEWTVVGSDPTVCQ